MDRSMIIIVQPQKWDANAEEWVGVTDDTEQMKLRWNEYERLQIILRKLGFAFSDGHNDRTIQFNCNGCNWDSKMVGVVCEISSQNIALLEQRAAELAAIRDRALAKLTVEEQHALRLLELP